MNILPEARNELDLVALYFIVAFVCCPLFFQIALTLLGVVIPLPNDKFALAVSPPAVAASVLIAGFIVIRKSERLGIKFVYRAAPRYWVYAPIGVAAIYLVLSFFGQPSPKPEEWLPKLVSNLPTFWRLVFLGFLGPIFEEYVFRGLLYSWFCKKYSLIISAMFTTTIFVLLHFQIFFGLIYDTLAVLLVGTLLMALRIFSKSLGPSTLAHILNNLFSLIR